MTLEGSVAEHLFDIKKQKTCCIPHIYEYLLFPVPQEEGDSRIYCWIDIQLTIK